MDSESALALPVVVLGHHWLFELHGCLPERLDDPVALRDDCLDAARAAGATVVGVHAHRFVPHGVSAVVVLSESHLTLHSWPEHRYAAVDLFSCSPHIQGPPAAELLASRLGATDVLVSGRLRRGVLTGHSLDRTAPLDLDARGTSLSWRERHARAGALRLVVDLAGVTSGASEVLARIVEKLATLEGLTPVSPALTAPARLPGAPGTSPVDAAVQSLENGVATVLRFGARCQLDVVLLAYHEPTALAAAAASAVGASGYSMHVLG